MLDPTALLNSDFITIFFGGITTFIAHYTQDSHGKTKPFVVWLSFLFGVIIVFLIEQFGYETVWQVAERVFLTSIKVLSFASTAWLFFISSGKPGGFKEYIGKFVVKIIQKRDKQDSITITK